MQKQHITNIEINRKPNQTQDNNKSISKLSDIIPKGYGWDLTTKKIGFITRNILLCLLFGFIYYFLLRNNNVETEWWKPFYFSLITQTTLGYDWLLPKEGIYYGVNSIHLILIWSMIIFEFMY